MRGAQVFDKGEGAAPAAAGAEAAPRKRKSGFDQTEDPKRAKAGLVGLPGHCWSQMDQRQERPTTCQWLAGLAGWVSLFIVVLSTS